MYWFQSICELTLLGLMVPTYFSDSEFVQINSEFVQVAYTSSRISNVSAGTSQGVNHGSYQLPLYVFYS